MSQPFYTRAEVAERLAITPAMLVRYEGRGLIRAVEQADGAGYTPVEVRRLWTIVTFQRDLGINLAGIEVILRLRDQLAATHDHLGRLARDLQALADEAPIDAEAR